MQIGRGMREPQRVCRQFSRLTVILDSATRLHDLVPDTSSSSSLTLFSQDLGQSSVEQIWSICCATDHRESLQAGVYLFGGWHHRFGFDGWLPLLVPLLPCLLTHSWHLGRLPFKIKLNAVRQALERGCYFEVSYGPALRGKLHSLHSYLVGGHQQMGEQDGILWATYLA